MCLVLVTGCPSCNTILTDYPTTLVHCNEITCAGSDRKLIKLQTDQISDIKCPKVGCIFNQRTKKIFTSWKSSRGDSKLASDLFTWTDMSVLFTGADPVVKDFPYEDETIGTRPNPAGGRPGSGSASRTQRPVPSRRPTMMSPPHRRNTARAPVRKDPNRINRQKKKPVAWGEEECARLTTLYNQGMRYRDMVPYFPGRSEHDLGDRACRLKLPEKKKQARLAAAAAAAAADDTAAANDAAAADDDEDDDDDTAAIYRRGKRRNTAANDLDEVYLDFSDDDDAKADDDGNGDDSEED